MEKTIKLLLGIVFITFLSCSQDKNIYEETISDFVQTDKKGTKYDMKFKSLEIKEVKRITVADSIQYLTAKMETERNKNVQQYEQMVLDYQNKLKTTSSKGLQSQYKESIEKYEKKVLEWKNWDPHWIDNYKNRPVEDVLSIIVYCKYSLVPPTMNTTIEEARYFVLSADAKKCYRKMRKLN